MDCMSLLVVEAVSVSVSPGLELIDSCDSLVDSFDSLDSLGTMGAGKLGLDSGEVSAFGVFVTFE